MDSPLKTGTRVEVGASEQKHDRFTISSMDPATKFVLGIPIPLNQADAAVLAMIPGISESLAHRIVLFRNTQGSFRSFNDVNRVKGVGPKKLERLSSYLSIE
jgi:competence protein ComEA